MANTYYDNLHPEIHFHCIPSTTPDGHEWVEVTFGNESLFFHREQARRLYNALAKLNLND